MAVKLLVLYTAPDDPDAWDRHYLDVHVPLAAKVPGVQRFEGARVIAAPDGGEQTWFRTAELWFEDLDALGAGLGSPEGQATAADFQQIAPPGSRMFIAQLD